MARKKVAKKVVSLVIEKGPWTLYYVESGKPVHDGDLARAHDGALVRVAGGTPPRKPTSSGLVWVRDAGKPEATTREDYPANIGAEWRRREEAGGSA